LEAHLSAIVSGDDYIALPREPQTWLIEGLCPVGGAMLLYGDPKVGKSFAALQLACNLATGTDWLGYSCPEPVAVVYVQLDTPRSLWADRVSSLRTSGWPTSQVLFADRETLDTWPFDVLNPNHFAKLTTELKSLRGISDEGEPYPIEAGAVIIDTIRESHSGDENDSTAMQAVIAHLTAAVKPAALILVSHAKKQNPEYGYDLMNDNRGSSYVVGRMDAIARFSHSSVRVSSRSMEEHSTKIERNDDGTWSLAQDTFKADAKMLLDLYPDKSIRELARLLKDKTSRGEEACRGTLRRLQAASQR
jgi:RecA-family ATPase